MDLESAIKTIEKIHGFDDPTSCAGEAWAVVTAELERLRGIVAKLPKTADGVPVVEGMELYRPEFDYAAKLKLHYGESRMTCRWYFPNPRCPHMKTWMDYPPGQCYSTSEAATDASNRSKAK